MIYGFIKSKLDGTEKLFTNENTVPDEFRYKMPAVIDQGDKPICTACSSSAFLNWQWHKDFNLDTIFKNSKPCKDGAEFKNVFKYLKSLNLIKMYAMVPSTAILKTAIYVNGPCIAGLPVYSFKGDFWNGEDFKGGHAIAIVGWNKEGFIIRNSWGSNWNGDGYTVLPYEDFNKFIEIWTLI